MAERLVVDFAWSHPTPALIKHTGYEGVLRYLSHDPSKNLSLDEAAALRAQGLSIALVWETNASRASDGVSAGVTDAQDANAQASVLHYPLSCAIYYAVDFDADPGQVDPYFHGVQSVGLRPVGIYGGIRVIEGINVPYRWQTVAWSHGAISSYAHLYQRLTPTLPHMGHFDYDENLILKPEYGQWKADPTPPPAPIKEEELTYLTVDENGTEYQVFPCLGKKITGTADLGQPTFTNLAADPRIGQPVTVKKAYMDKFAELS